jgi:hypothetical protein
VFTRSTIFCRPTRVARWHSFKPKIPNSGINFGGSCNGSCRPILWPFGVFYCRLVSGNPASDMNLVGRHKILCNICVSCK